MATAEEWRTLAAEQIVALLKSEHAVTQPEMEAKISDPLPVRGPRGAQPHHLTTARQRLLAAGQIASGGEVTRGGRSVRTYHLAGGPVKVRVRAAARKRLLHTRFLSWTATDGEIKPSPISALEKVVQESLSASAPYGYRLLRPAGGGEVITLLGESVPGGGLDNAAFYTPVSDRGIPMDPITTVIEVKNVRQWIYPSTQELYQLLDKAAQLQLLHPDSRFQPVLVCRRVHSWTGQMAKQMGFYVVGTWRQYLRPIVGGDPDEPDSVERRLFDEVNEELAYNLELHEAAVDPLINHFTTLIPERMPEGPDRWKLMAEHLSIPTLLRTLRDDAISGDDRKAALTALAEAADEVTGETGKWGPKHNW